MIPVIANSFGGMNLSIMVAHVARVAAANLAGMPLAGGRYFPRIRRGFSVLSAQQQKLQGAHIPFASVAAML